MSTILRSGTGVPEWLNTTQYPFRRRTIEVDGGAMNCVDEGVGRPILFLHGLPAWSYVFRHLIRGLNSEFRCIAPDMIGSGLSDKPPVWSYSPMAHAHNLGMLIDQLGTGPVTLVMHDYGVAIGMAYAVDNPGRIERLVVINGACWDLKHDPAADRLNRIASGPLGRAIFAGMNNWPRMVRRSFGDREKCGETFMTAILGPTLAKTDRIGLWKALKAMTAAGPFLDDIWERRRNLTDIPFEFIWGMKDPVFGERYLNRWWHEYPLAPVERLTTSGHYPMEEQPAAVLARLREFMSVQQQLTFLA